MIKKTIVASLAAFTLMMLSLGCGSQRKVTDYYAENFAQDFAQESLTISREVALEIVEDKIDTVNYTVVLNENTVQINNKEYYIFRVAKGNTQVDPMLAVRITDGELFCCTEELVLSAFTDFPLQALKKHE